MSVLAIIVEMAIYGNSFSGLGHGTIETREPTRKPSFVFIDGKVTPGNNIRHGEYCTVIFY